MSKAEMQTTTLDDPGELLDLVKESLGLPRPCSSTVVLLGRVGSFYAYSESRPRPDGKTIVLVTPFLAMSGVDVAKHFHLTPTQARVAALIACRRSNSEIADAIGISPNTARRHTEAVMFRMRVASRCDVERLICAFLARNNVIEGSGTVEPTEAPRGPL
jgi:DNA-binding CsgD family transcriptional regulator